MEPRRRKMEPRRPWHWDGFQDLCHDIRDRCVQQTSTSLASNTGGGPGLLGASNYMKLLAASRMEENPLNFQRNTKHGIHTHCVTEDIPGGCDASDLAPAGFVSPAILTDEGSDLHRTILHAIWSVTLTHNRPCLPIASVSNEIVSINGSGMMKILPATKQVNGLQLENSIAFHMVYNGAFMRSLHGDGFSIPIRRSYENLLKGCNTDTNRSTCSAGHEGEEDSDSIESVEMEGFGPPHEITSTRKMDASKRLLQQLGIDVNFDASTYSGISHGKDKGADSNWITESRRSKKNKDKIYEKKIEVMKSHSNDGALECEARGSHNSAVVCLDGSDDQCVESYREGIRLIREWCYEYGKRVDVSPIFGKKLEVFTTPSRGLFYLTLSHKNREVTLILHGRSLYFIAWIGGKGTFELADDRKVLGNIGQKLSKVAANYSKLCNICDVKIGLVALRRAFEVLYKSDGRDSKDLTSSLACMIVHFPEAVRLQCVLNTICEYFPFSDKTVKSGKDLVFWIGYYGKYSSEAMDRLTSLLQGTYPDPIVNCGAGKFRSSYELIREIRVIVTAHSKEKV